MPFIIAGAFVAVLFLGGLAIGLFSSNKSKPQASKESSQKADQGDSSKILVQDNTFDTVGKADDYKDQDFPAGKAADCKDQDFPAGKAVDHKDQDSLVGKAGYYKGFVLPVDKVAVHKNVCSNLSKTFTVKGEEKNGRRKKRAFELG